MSGPYQRHLSNCGAGRLHVAINSGILSVKSSNIGMRDVHKAFVMFLF